MIAFNHVRAARELTFARTEATVATVKKEAEEMMVLIDKMLREAGAPQMEERFELEEERFSLTASPSAGKPKKRR